MDKKKKRGSARLEELFRKNKSQDKINEDVSISGVEERIRSVEDNTSATYIKIHEVQHTQNEIKNKISEIMTKLEFIQQKIEKIEKDSITNIDNLKVVGDLKQYVMLLEKSFYSLTNKIFKINDKELDDMLDEISNININ